MCVFIYFIYLIKMNSYIQLVVYLCIFMHFLLFI